jgi:hypothetical protein
MCRTPHDQEHVQHVQVRLRDRSGLSSFEQWLSSKRLYPREPARSELDVLSWTSVSIASICPLVFTVAAVEQATLEVRPPIDMRNFWRLPWCQRHFDRVPAGHQPTQQR